MDFENIRNLLGEAYTEDVENAIKSLVDGASGGQDFVPKSKYDKIKEQYDTLSQQATYFQGAETEKADLQKRIVELETSKAQLEKDSEAKLTALKNDYLFEKKLGGYKPKNLKAVSALINKDKLTFKEDDIEGLQEQIEELQKSDSFLFEQEESVGTGVPYNATALKQSTSPLDDERLRKAFGLD